MAATLDWQPNSEPDMKDYQVWGCFTPNCVVIKTQAMLLGTVPHVAGSTARPSFVVDIANKEGALAVSARDQSLNESPLSVPRPFDRVAPAAPPQPELK